MSPLSILALLLAELLLANARPDGAPVTACTTLTPSHSGIQPQRAPPPFAVTVYTTEHKVRVKISSDVGDEFEGFILQARSSKDKSKMVDGKFTRKEGVSRSIDCFGGKENTLTQFSPTGKREIITEWTPSSGVNEDVVFRATVAKTFAIFWTEIDSPAVPVSSGGGGNPPVSGKHQDHSSGSSSSMMYHDCFVARGCFGLPSGCVNGQDCEVLLSYGHTEAGISFTLHGYLESMMYMAMGISEDGVMGEDFVTDCFRKDSTVRARQSWNQGKSNQLNTELASQRYDGSFRNGLTKCSWTSEYLSRAPNGKTFDLENNTYYVLLAKGPINEVTEGLGYHSARIASSEAVNFTAFEAISSEGVSDSVKVHDEESSFPSVTKAHSHDTEEYPGYNGTLSESQESGASCCSYFTISNLIVLSIAGLALLRSIP